MVREKRQSPPMRFLPEAEAGPERRGRVSPGDRSEGAGRREGQRASGRSQQILRESAALSSDCRLSGKAGTGVSFATWTPSFGGYLTAGGGLLARPTAPAGEKAGSPQSRDPRQRCQHCAPLTILAPGVEAALARPLGGARGQLSLSRHQVGGGRLSPAEPPGHPGSGQASSRWVSPNQSPRDFKGHCRASQSWRFPSSIFPLFLHLTQSVPNSITYLSHRRSGTTARGRNQ